MNFIYFCIEVKNMYSINIIVEINKQKYKLNIKCEKMPNIQISSTIYIHNHNMLSLQYTCTLQ